VGALRACGGGSRTGKGKVLLLGGDKCAKQPQTVSVRKERPRGQGRRRVRGLSCARVGRWVPPVREGQDKKRDREPSPYAPRLGGLPQRIKFRKEHGRGKSEGFHPNLPQDGRGREREGFTNTENWGIQDQRLRVPEGVYQTPMA